MTTRSERSSKSSKDATQSERDSREVWIALSVMRGQARINGAWKIAPALPVPDEPDPDQAAAAI